MAFSPEPDAQEAWLQRVEFVERRMTNIGTQGDSEKGGRNEPSSFCINECSGHPDRARLAGAGTPRQPGPVVSDETESRRSEDIHAAPYGGGSAGPARRMELRHHHTVGTTR